MRTITKAAEELNVSRTKIYNLIEKLDITTKRGSKNNLIEDDDYEKIKEFIENERFDSEETSETVEPNNTIQDRMRNVLDRDRNVLYGNVSDREYTDLKERIKQLEQQIDRKDQQIQEQSGQLMEAMKANTTLIESNKELNMVTSQLNIMVYKTLSAPNAEESITVDNEKDSSWLKKIFKKSK
jgi:DNA-binding transcriptional MerR regulator